MIRCPSCEHAAPAECRSCPACGAPLHTGLSTAADMSLDRTAEAAHPALDQTSFLPGAMLAKRYRIISLLGRGGMGEVYRADDLKLGQAVALKFLPAAVQRDTESLKRFLNEVKVALRVTHPNVCRVYDVGEVDGQHFLSMEYVDGEDLASLLKRIGRLPHEKAVQIARQLCAGLAAAHEEGIVHRDLKPANVMIDGRGRAKIADFGLAALVEAIGHEEVRSGTPAYMAPEQLAGKEVTVRSDLYSLALVLYELFTGKRAFEAATPSEMLRLEQKSSPKTPSSHVEGLDPAVERVIMRCLEREPHDRPASASAVAASLPGGDPLAAALAAGETPSPDMVAAAGGEGALRPGVAIAVVLFIVAGIAVLWLTPGPKTLLDYVPLPKAPAVFAERARQIATRFGYTSPPEDSDYAAGWRWDYLTHIRRTDSSPERWKRLASGQPRALVFVYRESPRALVPRNPLGLVGDFDPPMDVSGMIRIVLDSKGRLCRFQSVPPQLDESEDPAPSPDWNAVFEEAGLVPSSFTSVRPKWVPEAYSDTRVAWEGTYPDNPDVTIRLEAGAYRGKPVFFSIVEPWDRPYRMEEEPSTDSERVLSIVFTAMLVGLAIGTVLVARHHLRTGRADREGAVKLGLVVFLVSMVAWSLGAHHVADPGSEILLLVLPLASIVFLAAVTGLMYVVVEPFVRRRWPETMVSWSRLLAGRVRDPRIGRDILMGGAVGVGVTLVESLERPLERLSGIPESMPEAIRVDVLEGGRRFLAHLVSIPLGAILLPIGILLCIVLLRIVLRRQWLASVAAIVFLAVLGVWVDDSSLGSWLASEVVALLTASLLVLTLARFGFLAAGFATVIAHLASPSSQRLAAWYSSAAVTEPLLGLLLVAYGFVISLGGRPLLRTGALDP